jgi:hypothetical protein
VETARLSGSSNALVPEPTPAELEAGASLIQEPERLESRATDQPPQPASVQGLVDRHPSSQGAGGPHRGVALAIGGGAVAGPGIAVGGEASVGVVVDIPAGGASLNHATSAPGGPRELNGITASVGPSIGGDIHYFEGNTTERWCLSLDQLKDAMRRFAGLPGILRFGS